MDFWYFVVGGVLILFAFVLGAAVAKRDNRDG